jgi:hypothetical protein
MELLVSGAEQEPSVVFVWSATWDALCWVGVLTGSLCMGSRWTGALTPGLVLGMALVEVERRASVDPLTWPPTGESGEGPPQPMMIMVATTAPRRLICGMTVYLNPIAALGKTVIIEVARFD